MPLPPVVNLEGARVITVVPSGAFVAAPAAIDYQGFRDIVGLSVTLSVTAITTAASVSVQVLGVDETSGGTYLLGTIPVLTTVGQTTMFIHPARSNTSLAGGVLTQNGQVPPRIRVQVIQGNANSTTYSVGLDCTS